MRRLYRHSFHTGVLPHKGQCFIMGDRRLKPDGDLHTKAAVLTGEAALCHLAAVLLQQIVKAGPQLIRILQLHQNFLCREGVRPHREAVENDLDGNEDSRLDLLTQLQQQHKVLLF